MEFTREQLERFARQIVLPEIGGEGQMRLLRARVLVVGAGGLGSPLLLYLAAAGVGTLGIVDDDTVDVSNLQRQVLHATADIGRAKVESAAERVRTLDPNVTVARHRVRIDTANAADIAQDYDLVADGSDNLATRVAVHDACFTLGKPLVSASVQGWDGQLTTYKAHLGPPHPCLRCVFPDVPSAEALPSCAQGGVLGPAAGVMGCLQAVEVVKELLGFADASLSGTLLLYDALSVGLERIRTTRSPACGTGCVRLGRPCAAGPQR